MGCLSSLIKETTHNPFFIIHVGKDFKKVPINLKQKNVTIVQHHCQVWRDIYMLIMDDDSITRRPFWAWFEHEAKEMRLPRPVDEDTNYDEDVHRDSTYIISSGLSDEKAS